MINLFYTYDDTNTKNSVTTVTAAAAAKSSCRNHFRTNSTRESVGAPVEVAVLSVTDTVMGVVVETNMNTGMRAGTSYAMDPVPVSDLAAIVTL